MRTGRQRNADVKLMLAATVAVLLAGFVIAAGIYVAVSDTDRAACGRLPVGPVDSVRDELETGGPSFQSGGANCSFWLAIDDGDIVAYPVEQPEGCELDLKREKFVCDGKSIDPDDLAQYPVSTITRDDIDTVLVDLTGLAASTTTTASTTTSTPPTT